MSQVEQNNVVQFPSGSKQRKELIVGKHDLTVKGVFYKFHIEAVACGYDLVYSIKAKIPEELFNLLVSQGVTLEVKDGFVNKPVTGCHLHISDWIRPFKFIVHTIIRYKIRALKKNIIRGTRPKKEAFKKEDLLNI